MARIKYKEAIGLEVKRGRPAKGNKPSEKILKKLYIKESRSIREKSVNFARESFGRVDLK